MSYTISFWFDPMEIDWKLIYTADITDCRFIKQCPKVGFPTPRCLWDRDTTFVIYILHKLLNNKMVCMHRWSIQRYIWFSESWFGECLMWQKGIHCRQNHWLIDKVHFADTDPGTLSDFFGNRRKSLCFCGLFFQD